MSPSTRPNFFAIRWFLIGLLLFGLGWIFFSTPVSGATAGQANDSVVGLQATQATITPTPTEFSEEVVREGQPTGIIVGAIVIVLIILLGTVPTLVSRNHFQHFE